MRPMGGALLIISGSQDRQAAQDLAAKINGPTLVTGGRYGLLTTAALLSKCRCWWPTTAAPCTWPWP